MAKYSIEDVIDVLTATYGFTRAEAYEPMDQYAKKYLYVEWDQGKDPIGSSVELTEQQALKSVEHFLKTKNITFNKDYTKVSLSNAHSTSFVGLSGKEVKAVIEDLDAMFNLGTIIRDIDTIREQIKKAGDDVSQVSLLDYSYRVILDALLSLKNARDEHSVSTYRFVMSAIPVIDSLLVDYQSLKYSNINLYRTEVGEDPDTKFAEAFMSVFSKEPLTMAADFQNTAEKIKKAFDTEFNRPDTMPAATMPWEMRIGGSKFFVPPIDVKVSQHFKTGSLSGGAIRQPTSPKFNSGHSETAVQITLYFPNLESIWGLKGDEWTSVLNFDNVGESSDEDVDYFLSSLRGLIAQFKYAPFLPIRNQYLNQAWNITGVTLNNMTISTVENYPFCVAVTLQMMKFNHKVFLPMIEDFHQAIHWGRFRQYMGRAAKTIQNMYNVGFLVEDTKVKDNSTTATTELKPYWDTDQVDKLPYQRPTRKTWFENNTHIKFYYPSKTTGEIFSPDDSMFRQEREDENVGSPSYEKDKASWEVFLGYLGVDVDQYPTAIYDSVVNYSERIPSGLSEMDYLAEYLRTVGVTIEDMGSEKLEKYKETRIDQLVKDGTLKSPQAVEDYKKTITETWYDNMFMSFANTPFYRNYLQNAQFKDGKFTLQEWDIPMDQMLFDEKSVFIQGITVSLANNFAKLQVQLHDEPTYQHIGGGDNRLDIAMIVTGEDNLIRVRRMFDRIGGLARIEHAHGVLGFLGVKNELTALAGIKYLLPLTYEVDTVPGFPRVYNVRLSFTDFDVFQQKREKLSSEQQRELVELFGKRNPFLRIKQAWGRFNAYPDFPLTIKDPDTGKVVGTLEPDFYFKTFKTIDDDIVNWSTKPEDKADTDVKFGPNGEIVRSATTEDDPNSHTAKESSVFNSPFGFDVTPGSYAEKESKTAGYKFRIRHHMLTAGENQDESATLDIEDGGRVKPGVQKAGEDKPTMADESIPGVKLTEDTGVASMQSATIDGLTPGAAYSSPYAYGSNDPSRQYELMMQDTKYRDINGRMVRAFPTYMLWLIDEGGRYGGVKLFDNFYGLQSVLDFSVNRSEDIMGDTLVLRLSNLYSKISTPFKGFVKREDGTENLVLAGDNEGITGIGEIPEALINRYQNMKSGMIDDYVLELDSIRLKPGVRVHLRVGYSANPNALDVVFNGVITQVQSGEITEVIAQSDAIELSQYINSTNKKGHSGKIDGSLGTGFWMSEPRDLMVRLLSMGSSRFKEAFAHATRGQVFSENRFGIRHFGSILYEPLNDLENKKHALRAAAIQNKLQTVAGTKSIATALNPTSDATQEQVQGIADDGETYNSMLGGGFNAFLGSASVRLPLLGIMQSMWTNFFTKRDFELFKRNIYPGNGTGVAQFLGGDLLDVGPIILEKAGVKGPDSLGGSTGQIFQGSLAGESSSSREAGKDPWSGTLLSLAMSGKRITDLANPDENETNDPNAAVYQTQKEDDGGIDFPSGVETLMNFNPAFPMGGTITEGVVNVANAVFRNKGSYKNNPLLQTLGLAQGGEADDDLSGFDEVSFRAQTYMKTVWDMFQLCASLLPNYIVAVRPFEDRSTVFYGKPHWLYTSGVIPLSTGVPKNDNTLQYSGIDDAFNKLLREATKRANPVADYEEQLKFFNDINTANPFTTKAGTDTSAAKYSSADNVMKLASEFDGAKIPAKSGKTMLGKHLTGLSVRSDTGRTDLVSLARQKLERESERLGRNDYTKEEIEEDARKRIEDPAYDPFQDPNSFQNRISNMQNTLDILRSPDEGANYDLINKIIYDPNFFTLEEKSYVKPINESHLEVSNLPEQYKYANYNEYTESATIEDAKQEQYYIMMRWPFLNWPEVLNKPAWENAETAVPGFDDYRKYQNKRIAVANPKTNKVVICSIIYNSPSESPQDVSFVAKVSPDAYFELGLTDTDNICYFGFVPKTTSLGPTSGANAGASGFSSGGEIPVPHVAQYNPNDQVSERPYDAVVQPFQGTETMIAQLYPDREFSRGSDRFNAYKELYSESNYFATSFLYGWMQGNNYSDEERQYKTRGPRQSGVYSSGGDNPHGTPEAEGQADARYVEQYIAGATNAVSIDTRMIQGSLLGNYDIVGEIARRIYDDDYNNRRAEIAADPEYAEKYKTMGFENADLVKAEAAKTKALFESMRKKFSDNFGGISESEAESVWDQFRYRWHIRYDDEFKEVKQAAKDFVVNHLHMGIRKQEEIDRLSPDEKLWWDGVDKDGIRYNNPSADDNWVNMVLYSTNMTKVVNNFKMLLWRIPFARAWLAITTSRNTQSATADVVAGGTFLATSAATGGNIAAGAAAGIGAGTVVQAFGRGEFDFENSEVTKLWQWYLGVNTDGSAEDTEAFSPELSELLDAAALKNDNFFTELTAPTTVSIGSFSDIFKHGDSGKVIDKFIKALERYNTPGLKGQTPLQQTTERIGRVWDDTIGAFFSMVSSALTGVVGMFRMSLMEMGYGMGMLGAMQQQANIMNKAFNDSIYYSLGEPGSLIWLADNPFTREYGEPVVEIREPFQRIHYLNSFQDILDNGIIENLNNVPTVITASSDGKYPVTVYFDKGASPEKQFEIGVETGIFWDNARGSGFFGFLHPLLHPIETMRGMTKSATGSSDEILSRRIALHNLKEGLKDIYQGELLILGKADIRPHDLIYLSDAYERMYGIFEVEAVTHHFTSDTGFVTAVAPNALVTINDPAKWTMQSWIWGALGVQDTRNHVRHLMSVTADKSSRVYTKTLGFVSEDGIVDMSGLAESIQSTLRGNVQYTGGNSNLLKDIATHASTGYATSGNGNFMDKTEEIMGKVGTLFNSPFATLVSSIPIIGSGAMDIAWSGWTWVRDNLLDQHGCYIQYLSKDGQPMDSGLSFNQGVAVGWHHTTNLLPGIFNLEVKTTENGHRRITANDLMSQIGWSEVDISGVQRQSSWWNNFWNAKVLELAGQSPDPIAISPPTAYLARVVSVGPYGDTGVKDGDTFKAIPISGSETKVYEERDNYKKLNPNATEAEINAQFPLPNFGKEVTYRLAGIDTPELEFKQDPERNDPYSKAYLAKKFLEDRLIYNLTANGFEPVVAIRESTGAGSDGMPTSQDIYGRTLAVVFSNAPSDIDNEFDRRDALLRAAQAWPLIPWDAYMADGKAYTANWELVMAGLGIVSMKGVLKNDPDRGYSSGAAFGSGSSETGGSGSSGTGGY